MCFLANSPVGAGDRFRQQAARSRRPSDRRAGFVFKSYGRQLALALAGLHGRYAVDCAAVPRCALCGTAVSRAACCASDAARHYDLRERGPIPLTRQQAAWPTAAASCSQSNPKKSLGPAPLERRAGLGALPTQPAATLRAGDAAPRLNRSYRLHYWRASRHALRRFQQ